MDSLLQILAGGKTIDIPVLTRSICLADLEVSTLNYFSFFSETQAQVDAAAFPTVEEDFFSTKF